MLALRIPGRDDDWAPAHRRPFAALVGIIGLLAGTAMLPVPFADGQGLAPICSPGRAFPTRHQHVVGRSFGAVAVDLNGDGLTDIVSRHSTDGFHVRELLVLLASDEGTFTPLPFVSFGDSVYRLVAADFDGDGVPDVAVTTGESYGPRWTGTVSIYLNDGAGNLGLAGSAPCGDQILGGLAASDFDADGNADVVVSRYADASLHVFLGDGRGGLAEGPVLENVKAGPLAAGDFDQDGVADIAVASPGALRVFRGSPDLAFAESEGAFLPTQMTQLEAADLDRDGRLDLVARGTYALTILRNADLGFEAIGNIGVGIYGLGQIAVADLDADGAPEIIAQPSASAGCVSGGEAYCSAVLQNDGSGHYEWSQQFVVGQATSVAVPGSFNGDDATDLAFLQGNSSSPFGTENGWIAVMPGSPTGLETSSVLAPAKPSANAAAIVDVNGDGLEDLVAAGILTKLDWMPNLGGRSFGTPVPMSLPSGFGVNDIALADLNGDGWIDAAVAGEVDPSGGPNGIATLMWNPASSWFNGSNPVESAADCRRIVAADLDDDGDADLVASTWQPAGVCILANLGAGQFAPPTFVPLSGARAVTIVDLQQDGLPEIVVGDLYSSRIWLIPNLGDQVFGEPIEIPLPALGAVQDLASGDLDGNGTADVVAALGSQGDGPAVHVVTILVDREGQLGPPLQTTFDAAGILRVVLGNFTPDGRLDAAVSHGPTSGFTVLSGLGNGHFEPIGTYGTVQFAAIAAADLDDDGDDDVMSVRAQVLLHENRSELIRIADLDCDGTVGPVDLAELLSAWGPCAPWGCATGDLDGDGEIGGKDLAILLSGWGS